MLRLYRKPRLYFHELEVYNEKGVEIGLAKRVFSFFHRVISVNDNRGTKQLRVIGPIWSPWTFNVYEGKTKVAVMSKKWAGFLRESFTDADKFNIQFEVLLSNSKKRLSIATLMLIDSLYFEGKKSFYHHLISAPGIQLIVFFATIWWFSTKVGA